MLTIALSRRTFLLTFCIICLIFSAKASVFKKACATTKECRDDDLSEEYICQDGYCAHEDFSIEKLRDVIQFLILFLVSGLANAGGIGGGPMIIPLLVEIGLFSLREAIPLSKVTIFAGSLTTCAFIIFKRHHTDKGKLLINYPLATVMVPAVLGGTQMGVLSTQILPQLMIAIVFTLLIIVSIFKMWKRLQKERKKEKALREEEKKQNPLDKPQEVTNSLVPSIQSSTVGQSVTSQQTSMEDQIRTPLKDLLLEQWKNYLYLFLGLAFLIGSTLVRGGHGQNSLLGWKVCSVQSWLVLSVAQVAFFGVSVLAVKINSKEIITYHPSVEKMIAQASKPISPIKLSIASYFSGFLAGNLGIGGGLVLYPLLLGNGFDARTSTAVSNLSVLFSSTSTTFQFVIAGAISFRLAWVLMVFSLVGAILGQLFLTHLVKKYRRPSIIIWTILIVMVISGLAFPAQIALSMKITWDNLISFHSPC